ncbi:ammonium transporter 1 member 2-like [Diprion similis]|uniref:ammonium transporter 1 member 2-like n=1 Tax=Diprion similis TaxID=362088 RepID=UPI001EF9834C|nr:ammonium transporter 1 member 2-like [Diprion similis]
MIHGPLGSQSTQGDKSEGYCHIKFNKKKDIVGSPEAELRSTIRRSEIDGLRLSVGQSDPSGMSKLVKGDSFAENYYDYGLLDRSNYVRAMNSTGYNYEAGSSAVFRSILTILLRVGFLLVQIGSVPVSNVNLILLHHIVDFCAVTLVYILVGFVIAFNGDVSGAVGEGVWIGDVRANMNDAILGWEAAVTASAICTCGIVGRMHAVGYLLTAILISGMVQPFLIHWAWTPRGWMADNSLTGKSVSFKDYGGGGTVHVVGGLSGFLGCATLGRRILRLRDIDDASLPTDSPGSAFAGYLLIFLGLQGFGLPISDHGNSKAPPPGTSYILINNLLAASTSSLFVVALHFALSREAFNYWTVTRCIQGGISGIVAIAAGVDLYSPLVVVGISCASGLVFYLVSRRVYRSALEDYCNIVATHLACALFGSFLAPLCGRPRGSDAVNHTMVLDVAWQVICILALISTVAVTMWPLFVALEVCGFLRNRSEFINHLRAITALERGPPRSYMQRLFFPGIESVYLQPGSAIKSEPGPQAMSPRMWRYQQEIARLEQTRTKQTANADLVGGTEASVAVPATSPTDKKVKKVRQIYTLPGNSVSGHVEVGGTGESLENESRPIKQGLLEVDDIMSKVLVEGGKNVPKDADNLQIVFPGNSASGQKYRLSKQLGTSLHRTQKFTSLHSAEPHCSEEKQTSDDPTVWPPSDFTVKVLMEPRREINCSSDSDDEVAVTEPFENLNQTV